ncbi:hypothetical protein GCM10007884_49790 [Methylobacterium brachythecii]|nr:hypothetical protein GCM10007884_49790 [Methylobacterium brachythecii]
MPLGSDYSGAVQSAMEPEIRLKLGELKGVAFNSLPDIPGRAPVSPASSPNGGALDQKRPRLTTYGLNHLGQSLLQVLSRPAQDIELLPPAIREAFKRLTSALSAQAYSDEQTFRRELLDFMPNMMRFALSLTKNETRADDLVQDSLLKAWRSRESFHAGTNLHAWLFTIVRNTFYSTARAKTREADVEINDNDLVSLPRQQGVLDLQDLYVALQTLPAAMRKALVLVTLESCSYEEAATRLQCKIGTVKSRVSRAREALSYALRRDAGETATDHMTLAVCSGAVHAA